MFVVSDWRKRIQNPKTPYWRISKSFYDLDANVILSYMLDDTTDFYDSRATNFIRYYKCTHAMTYMFFSNDEKKESRIYDILLMLLQRGLTTPSHVLLISKRYLQDVTIFMMSCQMNMVSLIQMMFAFGVKLECGLQLYLSYNKYIVWKELLEYGLNPNTEDDIDVSVVIYGNPILRSRHVIFLESNGFQKDIYVPQMALRTWIDVNHKLAELLIRAAQHVPTLVLLCQRVIWRHDILYHGVIPDDVMIPKKIMAL